MGTHDKDMEEALQAAVAKMNRPQPASSTPTADPLSILAALLPKLIENRAEKSELVEKLDELRSEDVLPLRKQLRLVRAKLEEIGRAQDALFQAVKELHEQQAATGEAVLHLARQMARLEIVADAAGEPDILDSLHQRSAQPPPPRRAQNQSTKIPRGIRKHPKHEQP